MICKCIFPCPAAPKKNNQHLMLGSGTYTPFGAHKAAANLEVKGRHRELEELARRCPEINSVACDTLGAYNGAGWKCKN